MFWNWRVVRIAVGLALLILGVIAVLPSITGYSSLDGTVNARFVIVAAPIEGTVLNSAPKSGTSIKDGQHLLAISNERVSQFALTELAAELKVTQERLQAVALQESKLNTLRSELQQRLDSYRFATISNLDQEIAMQKERIAINEAREQERKSDLARKEKLRVTGNIPESEIEKTRVAELVSKRESDAARFELERLERQRDAAQRGIYIGEGRNDVPYSLQRVDEISISLLDLAAKRSEQEARDVKLRQQIADEAERVRNLRSTLIQADFDGVMWRNNVVLGSNVVVGSELLRILDCRDLFVDILVHEVDYDDIYPGREAEVRLFGRDTAIPAQVSSVRGSRADIEDKVLAAELPRSVGKYARIRVQLSPSEINTDYENFCQVGRTAIVRFRTRNLPIIRWLRSLWFSIS